MGLHEQKFCEQIVNIPNSCTKAPYFCIYIIMKRNGIKEKGASLPRGALFRRIYVFARNNIQHIVEYYVCFRPLQSCIFVIFYNYQNN